MSRCVICDHCSDIDGGARTLVWDDRENGYVCSTCRSVWNDAAYYNSNPEDGEEPLLDEDADSLLEGLDILALDRVATDKGKT